MLVVCNRGSSLARSEGTTLRAILTMLRLLLVVLFLSVAHGFLQPQIIYQPLAIVGKTTSNFMSPSDDENGDDDIDPDALGDWRAFRMNLANTGLSSSTTTSIDGIDLVETPQEVSSIATPTPKSRPSSVSKQNEQLLNSQNAALAEEYLTGVWAHESAIPEVGGLICRMPLEAEIYRNKQSALSKQLQSLLDSEEYGGEDSTTIPTSLASSASTGGAASASASPSTTSSDSTGTMSRSLEDSASSDDDSTFSALAAKTVFWYRGAEKLLKRELVKITTWANPNGRIDPSDLDEASLEMLSMYMDHTNSWQEVCIVTEKDERTGSAKTLTINRPMAFKLSESLARLVLLGAYSTTGAETQNLVKFTTAFEQECGVYVGGPDEMEEPATMIHGIDDLPGATEISPGTGIYQGGLEAAMDGVLSGKYKPLDFRFFIGHTKYDGGKLDEAVSLGKYQPIACSRPLVLKQCIQLPKPLWHEGMFVDFI